MANAGIRWPRIPVLGATKEVVKKLLDALREYAEAWKPFSFLPWFFEKKWQALTYTHLSRNVAAVLAAIVVVRERDTLWDILTTPRWPRIFLEWLLIWGTVGALYAYKLELFNKRRAISDQELRFQKAADLISDELSVLSQFQGSKQEIEAFFDSTTSRIVEIAALAFSLPHNPRVDAGLMVKLPDEPVLKLVKWSTAAQYDRELKIKIPDDDNFDESGPAALAFVQKRLVYVPKKGGRVWPLGQVEGDVHSYWPSEPHVCWVESRPGFEKFQTVICVPISDWGVLNFSTREKDPFQYRDFAMAHYFAKVLGYAESAARARTPRGN